jgi:hypothetical protein
MYAFGPLPRQKRTGLVIGTHQKIDRVARRHITKHVTTLPFPTTDDILHFEGSRGPDGVKLKSPGRDEPRHFIDPDTATEESPLIKIIKDHQRNLSTALATGNTVRAAFEAAWLAHAVTDGLTPAHHDPFDEQLKGIRSENVRSNKVSGKIIMASNGSKRQFIKNNWSVATAAKPLSFKVAACNQNDIDELLQRGFAAIYLDMIHAVDEIKMYDRFKREGWTRTLARQTTQTLIPTIIHAVELTWLAAYMDAKEQLT